MDPLEALALTAAATLGLIALVLVVRRGRRRHAAARAEAAAQLARSQQQIDRLGARVEELSADVARAESAARTRRSSRPEQYVVTTLSDVVADDPDVGPSPRASREVAVPSAPPRRPQLGAALEGRIVDSLARHQGVSSVRDRVVDLAVQGVALAHGVRRALNPETLDRAAAEAHVARRRSRRVRRAEVREARRLVRHLRSSEGPVTIQTTRARDVA